MGTEFQSSINLREPASAASGASSADLLAETAARIAGDSTTLSSANTYTDGKVSNEATLRANADSAETAARVTGDSTTLANAKSYTDGQVSAEATLRANADSAESSARIAGDATTLTSAKTYTDGQVAAEAALRVSGDASTLTAAKAYADTVGVTPLAPNARTVALATAYQATANTKPALISVMVEATYTVTIASAQSDTMELVIGPTTAVATGTGTTVASWRSGLTGIALTIGLASIDRGQLTGMLPIGWYFAVRRTAGTAATIVSAFDQSMRS